MSPGLRRPVPAAALLLLAAGSAPAAGEEALHAAQAARAESLMDALYADHGDREVLEAARGLVGECLEAGNYRTAKYLSGQLAFHDPASLPARYLFLRILLAKGDEEEAEKDLRALLEERPSVRDAYGMLADLLQAQGRHREALEVLDRHLREHPGDAAVLDRRARVLLWDLRDLEGARAAAARMLAAAADPATPPTTAQWLRENADSLRAQADGLAADRERVRATAARLRRLLWGGVGAFALVLGAAAWMTRTGTGPEDRGPA